MKTYNERDIKSSEILQLIILHTLYSQKESKDIYFQGGTALRWCYSGNRFSEDLGFVTHLRRDGVGSLLEKTGEQIRRTTIAHFGTGEFEVRRRDSRRKGAHTAFVGFRPDRERKKISVKVEFEELREGFAPQTEKIFLFLLPLVRHLITVGEFRIPAPSSVILAETMEEILSDKIRALLEREYLKGRDFYDIWFLTSLNVRCDTEMVKRKTTMYEAPFTYRRSVDFFLNPDDKARKEISGAIRQDLSRFLSPQDMSMFESNGFRDMFNALEIAFSSLKNNESFTAGISGSGRKRK
jgi:predicted nucleotidyltransferase component of viral defense system